MSFRGFFRRVGAEPKLTWGVGLNSRTNVADTFVELGDMNARAPERDYEKGESRHVQF